MDSGSQILFSPKSTQWAVPRKVPAIHEKCPVAGQRQRLVPDLQLERRPAQRQPQHARQQVQRGLPLASPPDSLSIFGRIFKKVIPPADHFTDRDDRLLHHAVYRILYPFFDKTFIADSFSCRDNKGAHKAINRFRALSLRVSKNHTRTLWVLKCDIRRFFASIDHRILLSILRQYIPEQEILWLLKNIIDSFATPGLDDVGLPLGNLTSQLFANIYLNKFDQWVKHTLKACYYIRYADDFAFLSPGRNWLEGSLNEVRLFLQINLKLQLHPDKIFIKTLASGIDFLGWVHFSHHRVLRTKTKQRMLRKITESPTNETIQSYFGLLGHGNAAKLRVAVAGVYWLTCANSLL